MQALHFGGAGSDNLGLRGAAGSARSCSLNSKDKHDYGKRQRLRSDTKAPDTVRDLRPPALSPGGQKARG